MNEHTSSDTPAEALARLALAALEANHAAE